MGRTNPTFRDHLRHLETQWEAYRRALRHHDIEHYDRLFEHARAHADAAGHLNPTDPMPAILVSIALEHERHLASLQAEIDELESTLETLETADGETPTQRQEVSIDGDG